MANVFKRKGSPYYYGRFQHKLRDTWFSTKETEREKAEEKLKERLALHRIEDLFEQLHTTYMSMSEEQRHQISKIISRGDKSHA